MVWEAGDTTTGSCVARVEFFPVSRLPFAFNPSSFATATFRKALVKASRADTGSFSFEEIFFNFLASVVRARVSKSDWKCVPSSERATSRRALSLP